MDSVLSTSQLDPASQPESQLAYWWFSTLEGVEGQMDRVWTLRPLNLKCGYRATHHYQFRLGRDPSDPTTCPFQHPRPPDNININRTNPALSSYHLVSLT